MSIHRLRFSDLKGVQRGQEIVNYPIVHSKLGALNLKSGITRIPLGAVVSRHYHDFEEQVTVLEGRLRLNLGDQIVECGPHDSTFNTAGAPYEFTAIGDKPAVCMVTYGGSNTKRIFTETGERRDRLRADGMVLARRSRPKSDWRDQDTVVGFYSSTSLI